LEYQKSLGKKSKNENQIEEFRNYFYKEYEPHCRCEAHRTCKRGGDIASALPGISQATIDFIVGSLHDLQTAMIEAVEQSQASQMFQVENIIS